MINRPGKQRGFTLIEALVALAIIAGMTAALVETAGQDAHARHMMRERRLAMLLAQSALDLASGGADAGDSNGWRGLSWHLSRQPYGDADPLGHTRLEQLTVTVSDADQHPLVKLTTLRLAS